MKSRIARLIALAFKIRGKLSEEEAEEALNKLLEEGEVPAAAPKIPKTRQVMTPEGGIFYANEETGSGYTVFYIHGGGYEDNFSLFHWRFLNKVIINTDAMLIVPAYRLIPFACWKNAFSLIMPVYREYAVEHPEKKIILMGDSAGGGLALSLAEQIKSEGIRMPDELILMSPWVDVTMENAEIEMYNEEDPWLSVPWLKVAGRHWAGDLDGHAFQVSPIYGDLKGLRNVTIFMGTEEVFVPDIKKLFSLLDPDDSNELIIGEDMNHVYPLLPIPEAAEAEKIIFQKITRKPHSAV